MNTELTTAAARSLDEWIFNPSSDETINHSPFRTALASVMGGQPEPDPLLDYDPRDEPLERKVAKLVRHEVIIPDGDAIFVKSQEGGMVPLADGMADLRRYLHSDMKTAHQAAAILEQNLIGVTSGKIARGCVTVRMTEPDLFLEPQTTEVTVHLPTGRLVDLEGRLPELGKTASDPARVALVEKAFGIWNEAVGEDRFFEKVALYPFRLPYREKAFVVNGTGGDGKGVYTNLLARLYRNLATTDAPIPSFSGHDRFTATRSFIGKRLVVFNDVENPSEEFMEWLKPMTTGSMMVKELSSSSLVSMPCRAVFMLESNFRPEFMANNANIRRFVFRSFPDDFNLKDHLTDDELDILGTRGPITCGDMVDYLLGVNDILDWTSFKDSVLPEPYYFELTDVYITDRRKGQSAWVMMPGDFLKWCKELGLTETQRKALREHLRQKGAM